MPASQLSQLKAAITDSGLNKKNISKKDKQAFKKGGSREVDRQKTLAKLEDIRKGLNKFDERETKLKHDVGGRNLKGVTGKPSASKQAGLDQRRQNLLPEHQLRHHTGTFQDRRFGESNPSLSIEDRMLERYTRERQRGQGKKGMFNLEDDEEGLLGGLDDGEALGGMTHGGRNVLDLPGDDFVGMGLGRDEEDEDARGNINRGRVAKGHFGGFENGGEEDDQPERKKTKAEVMSEVIAKSKEHKYLRQQQKDLDEDMREALDEDIDGLRELLGPAAGPSRPPRVKPAAEDADYDQFVRTLAFEARAKPKDRTRTEEELALEEKEKLEEAEAKRLRRMRGEESEEEGDSRKRKRAAVGADDLDDDYVEDEEGLLGPGLTREDIENMGTLGEDDESGDEDEEDGTEGEEDDDEEDDEEDEDDDEENEDALEDLDEASEVGSVEEVVRKSKGKAKATNSVKEITYTFPCPSTIDELEDILDEHDDAAVPIIIQRIRALHHPSLAQGNKEKLQEFLGVLLDYFLVLASRPLPAFSLISTLHPHLISLVKLNPITAAQHFLAKLTLMQKNLTRGLARGAANPETKTFPGCAELVILRLIGIVWSTSDFSHPVAAPAVLLMGQYVGQARVRSVADLASGLFICSILAQYEAMSKRLIPEAIAFVGSSILALLSRRKGTELPKLYPALRAPTTDLASASLPASHEPVDLPSLMTGESDSEQSKADVLTVALRLVLAYSTLYSSFDAFIEIFTPISRVLETSRVAKLAPELKTLHSTTTSALTRMLGHARTSRQPLALQAHKPIPIATYAPRFEDDFAPGRHYDPDVERNSSAKVKALYKKERKGAIRELRKDNRFLAGEKAKERMEKDTAYEAKMKRVIGGINMERAEEKEMQREKSREKKRAGRN